MTPRRAAPLLAVAASLLLLGNPTGSQPPPSQPLPTFGEVVDVRVVNVDVLVVDRDGNPVTGLAREEFEVYEDGKRMEITNFAAYEEAAVETVERRRAALEGTAGDITTAFALPPPRATWVVYMDQSRLEPSARNQIAREAQRFLERSVGPDDQSLVATYDNLSLKLLSPLSGSLQPAIDALQELQKTAILRSSLRAQTSQLQSRIVLVPIGAIGSASEIEAIRRDIEALTEQEMVRSRTALHAFADLLAIVSGIQGRIALVFASGGFDTNPVENLYQFAERRFGEDLSGGRREFDVWVERARADYERLLSAVNSSRLTVYTVHGGEGRGADVSSAELGGAPIISGPSLSVGTSPEGPSTLTAFAGVTGGRSFELSRSLSESLSAARRDLSTYYSLGYRPTRETTGGFHGIDVRIARAGVRVVHREGIRERSRQEEGADASITALLGENAGRNELGISLAVGAPKVSSRGRDRLIPVTVRIPLQRATLLPEGESHRAAFEFHLAIRDPDGGFRRLERQNLDFSIPNAEVAVAQRRFVSYTVDLALKPGRYRVGVAAVDRLGGTYGAATAPVAVFKGEKNR